MKARTVRARTIGAAAAAAVMLAAVNVTGAFAYDGAESYDPDNVFTFSDSAVAAEDSSGEGFKISGTELTINAAGTYVVTGECVEGRVTVKKGTEGVVLILDDLSLTSSSGAPLSVNKGASAEIVIEGSNTLTDAEDPADESSEDADIADAFDGAAVKVKSGASVVFTGTGTLTADGSACKNGIKGAAESSVTVGGSSEDSFTLNVLAANNALAADGSITVNGGALVLEAEGDGLKASPDEEDTVSAGTVTVNGGSVTVTSGEDGIQADGGYTQNGGDISITAAGGHGNNAQITAADISAKGIKSDSSITVNGGTVTIDSADDGIHLNGTEGTEAVSLNGGVLTISSGDDGVHSDYILDINGSSITVNDAYEGLEGATITLRSGEGRIYTSDDGINAANSDLADYSFLLSISGGEWYIDAGGDGLDSNGDLAVSGGYTEVFGSANGGNAALDYGDRNASFSVTGGTVIGIGMSQMAVTPTQGSYIMFGSSGGMGGFGGFGGMGGRGGTGGFGGGTQQTAQAVSISAGDELEIRDSQGNTVYTGTAVKSADSIVYAGEALAESGTYYLYINGTQAASAEVTAGQGGQGGQGGPADQPTEPPTDQPQPPFGAQRGDTDRSGAVNMKDYALLQKYLNGYEVEIDLEAADLNGDGKVTMKDYSELQRVLNGIVS